MKIVGSGESQQSYPIRPCPISMYLGTECVKNSLKLLNCLMNDLSTSLNQRTSQNNKFH